MLVDLLQQQGASELLGGPEQSLGGVSKAGGSVAAARSAASGSADSCGYSPYEWCGARMTIRCPLHGGANNAPALSPPLRALTDNRVAVIRLRK